MSAPAKTGETKNISAMLDGILEFIDISESTNPDQLNGQQKAELLRTSKNFIRQIKQAKAEMVAIHEDQKDELILGFSDQLYAKMR